MVFLNFSKIPWAQARVNSKAQEPLGGDPQQGWRGSPWGWRKPFSRVVREMQRSSSWDGGHLLFGSQLFLMVVGRREGFSVCRPKSGGSGSETQGLLLAFKLHVWLETLLEEPGPFPLWEMFLAAPALARGSLLRE